jgi:hypothetical protein
MHRQWAKYWGLGDFMGENCNIYLSRPQKALPGPKTRVLTYYSPKSVYAFDYNPDLNRPKNGVRRPSWFSIFVILHHMEHFVVRIGVYMSNLIMIGLTVQKLLAFLFSIGNALKVPQNWGLVDFWGVKTVICIFLNPKVHFLGQKHAFWHIIRPNPSTRLITAPISIGQKMASGGHLGFSIFVTFHHRGHFVVSIGVFMSNLIMIRLTVQKLLTF